MHLATKDNRLVFYKNIREKLNSYAVTDIENAIIIYVVNNASLTTRYFNLPTKEIVMFLEETNFPRDLESIIEFFESLLSQDNKSENGIVFTPKYISDYIVHQTLSHITEWSPDIKIIDPSCGCGIFLVSAIEYLHNKFAVPITQIIENNILGADIENDNIRRCNLILKILAYRYDKIDASQTNLACVDSLKHNWCDLFNVTKIDFIIGNPPYVNPHDMSKETVMFLKSTFSTTQEGVFNLFYAFIEHSMSNLAQNGFLGFIVPNNFLTIKAATHLRAYLQKHAFINSILDFGDNMPFKPIRTYNVILLLSKAETDTFLYSTMPKTNNIEKSLSEQVFDTMPTAALDKNGWNLVSKKIRENLKKIESQCTQLKQFIRTGIATLRDAVYLVDKDDNGFYKNINGEKIYIEADIIKPIYKIPELKTADNLNSIKRYIIFPYKHNGEGYEIMTEDFLKQQYPKAYNCLYQQKSELDNRDKGKANPKGWYAYGRSQGLNKYGKKLMFPTFAHQPKFTYVDDSDALFCNGYAVFENNVFDLPFLAKILNSFIMKYYVANTSYSIEGNYYCYQKKYIERFSIPNFNDEEKLYIQKASQADVDALLIKKYGLIL